MGVVCNASPAHPVGSSTRSRAGLLSCVAGRTKPCLSPTQPHMSEVSGHQRHPSPGWVPPAGSSTALRGVTLHRGALQPRTPLPSRAEQCSCPAAPCDAAAGSRSQRGWAESQQLLPHAFWGDPSFPLLLLGSQQGHQSLQVPRQLPWSCCSLGAGWGRWEGAGAARSSAELLALHPHPQLCCKV